MVKSYSEKVSDKKLKLWRHKKPTLSWMDIEITERCNFNCVHCYINLPPNDIKAVKKELGTEKLKNILSEAASLGCLTVRFTGGEPLLREDFQELYVFTRKLGIKVAIFTNASLITSELVDLFLKIPPLVELEISIYGMKKKSCQAVTRTYGSLESVMEGINLLNAAGIPYIVKSTYLPQNKEDIPIFYDWASKNPYMASPPQLNFYLNLRCGKDQQLKNESILKLRPFPEDIITQLIIRNRGYRDEMKQFFNSFFITSGPEIFTCSGDSTVCMDAYGNYQLCLLLKHPETIVSSRDVSLKHAVTDFFPAIIKMKSENPVYLNRCAKCFLRCICEQCPAKSYLEHGTLDTPIEYFCRISHLQAIYLGLLKETEKAWKIKDWQKRVQAFVSPETNSES